MQILGVVIPKLEQLQQQGAVGQRKITQYTRYVTIALATLQATGLVFVFGTGRGAGYLSVNAPSVPILPEGCGRGPTSSSPPSSPAPPC